MGQKIEAIELSNKIANDSTFECLEQNKKLTSALQEANRREETLIEKYKRSSYKFKELKNQFDNTTARYKELIREKKECDEKQIELIKANQNLENTIKNRDIDLQKHKDSLSKVMKHYTTGALENIYLFSHCVNLAGLKLSEICLLSAGTKGVHHNACSYVNF